MTPVTEQTVCTVHVLLFSVLREQLGRASSTITLPEPATGSDLIDHLAAEHPIVGRYRPAIRLAVNQEYVPTDTPLNDGDEVALITPVSGG